MPQSPKYENFAEGAGLLTVRDKKFKRNRLSINLVLPLVPGRLSERAVVSQLLRHGCLDYPDFTAVSRRLDMLYGAALYADVGKIGAGQVVTLSISSLDDRYAFDGSTILSECAELLGDLVLNPRLEDGVFPEKVVDIERKNLIDTIEAEINDKRSYALMRCLHFMGRGDVLALRRYGSVEESEKITPQNATDAWRQLLLEGRIEIAAVGPGGGDGARNILIPALAGLERRTARPAPLDVVAGCQTPSEIAERLDVLQAKLVMGFRTGGACDAQTSAARRVMTALLGGTPFSKLFLNLRERLSLCYYCAARYDRVNAVMLIDVGLEAQNADAARQEILSQIESVKSGDFDDEMLENTKLLIANSLKAIPDSASALEEWYLGRILTGSLQTPQEELELIGSVTRDDVACAAKAVSLDTVYLLLPKGE
jgi:predicted Zn-dependent peptidase